MNNDELCKENERLRMQLAACGVAAVSNTPGSVKDRLTKESPYWSASYDEVCQMVDREMRLRQQLETVRKQLQVNNW